ncbi:MAG: hypothetical protein GY925_23400 [Actinomycetia bacterium]|nr:hypothetical protein [Actinomycetes bacterium]
MNLDRGSRWWIRTEPGVNRYVVGVGGSGLAPSFEAYQSALIVVSSDERGLNRVFTLGIRALPRFGEVR